jgi:hypothetical protein
MTPAFAARDFAEVPAIRRRFGDDCVTSAYPALAAQVYPNPSVALVEAHVCRTRPTCPRRPLFPWATTAAQIIAAGYKRPADAFLIRTLNLTH